MLTFYYALLILPSTLDSNSSSARGGLGETDAEWGNRALVLLDFRAEGSQHRGAFYSLSTPPPPTVETLLPLNRRLIISHPIFHIFLDFGETIPSPQSLSLLSISDIYANNPEDWGFPVLPFTK